MARGRSLELVLLVALLLVWASGMCVWVYSLSPPLRSLHLPNSLGIRHRTTSRSGSGVVTPADSHVLQEVASTRFKDTIDRQEAPPTGTDDVLQQAAVLVLTYDRANYLEESLKSLFNLQGIANVSVYISVDGAPVPAIQAACDKFPAASILVHERKARLEPTQGSSAYISQHYKGALDAVFYGLPGKNHTHVIVVEDDMVYSPDFLSYFRFVAPLLDTDPSLWCVSSWHDHSLGSFYQSPGRLLRTSVFPGLGWMIRRQTWDQLSPAFPLQNYDHWLRIDHDVISASDCVVPELSRSFNIGQLGSNVDVAFFNRYLEGVHWNRDGAVKLDSLDTLDPKVYAEAVSALINNASVITGPLQLEQLEGGRVHVAPYLLEDYANLVASLGVLPQPRVHYRQATVLRLPAKDSVATLVLANARSCALLPPSLRAPNPLAAAVPASQGQDCTTACARLSLQCTLGAMEQVNNCRSMRDHFPCERGCAPAWGNDMPAYPVAEGRVNSFRCLVTPGEVAKCSGSHALTRRLCGCVSA